MKIRVGVDVSVDEALLQSFTKNMQLVRIAEEPQGEIEVDFWIPMSLPQNCAVSVAAFERCASSGRPRGLA